MKSAGVLTSKAREHHALGASVAAMLLVVLASAIAAAQSAADTAASATWKKAAAAATAAATASPAAGAPIAEATVPAPSRAVVAPSGYSGKDAMPSNMVSTPPDQDSAQPGIAEIPPTSSTNASAQPQTPGTATDSQPSAQSQTANDGSEIARYEEEQSGMPPEQLRSIQQFDSEGELSTPFGMQLREAKRSLKSGEEADGLLIIAVTKDSPAAAVGLRAYNHTVHDAIAAAAMVGAVFSGGLSVVVIPALDYMQVGESYDMIIGVDGSRVTNFLDFQDRMRDLQPGEVVYLSILRDGKRVQLTMPVTANVLQANN
jgi:hypothetical protein